jgi:hypothetical protein
MLAGRLTRLAFASRFSDLHKIVAKFAIVARSSFVDVKLISRCKRRRRITTRRAPGNLRKRTTAAIYDVTGVVIPKENAVGFFG